MSGQSVTKLRSSVNGARKISSVSGVSRQNKTITPAHVPTIDLRPSGAGVKTSHYLWSTTTSFPLGP